MALTSQDAETILRTVVNNLDNYGVFISDVTNVIVQDLVNGDYLVISDNDPETFMRVSQIYRKNNVYSHTLLSLYLDFKDPDYVGTEEEQSAEFDNIVDLFEDWPWTSPFIEDVVNRNIDDHFRTTKIKIRRVGARFSYRPYIEIVVEPYHSTRER